MAEGPAARTRRRGQGGQVPRPQPDPGPARHPGAGRLAAPRGTCDAVPGGPPAAVRDRGADLVLPALPAPSRRRRSRCTSATTCPAGCRARTSGSRRSVTATGRTPTSSSPRCPASAGATRRPPWPSTSARRPPARRTRSSPRRGPADGQRRRSAATRGDAPWPNDPYAPGQRALWRTARRAGRRAGRRPDHRRLCRTPGCAGWAVPASRRARSGSWSPRRPATPKYVICNADESEPGTFKDRQILAEQPHLVLEGLLLGMVGGRGRGRLGLHPARVRPGGGGDPPRDRVAARRRAGRRRTLAGTGRRLSVEVFTSPGGYILGEESALIECMEGHRGEPRNKPPFPGIYGLWGQPTLMNSVETFAARPGHRPARSRAGGGSRASASRAGLKFFAVSGHVERPGVYCVPMGSTARQLLELAGGVAGGRALGAIQPGGASSNFLGPDQLDVPLDFDTAGQGRVNARLRCACGAGRGHRPARRGHERAALLPRRVMRQVRSLPGRIY